MNGINRPVFHSRTSVDNHDSGEPIVEFVEGLNVERAPSGKLCGAGDRCGAGAACSSSYGNRGQHFFTFALLGGVIFTLFGITLEAFRIAGGIILFGIAMGMIRRAQDEGEDVASAEDLSGHRTGRLAQDLAVIPLAIPFMSGPGSIATVMITDQ